VREAYTLLRQSIIHVEQDDIDFDEEELEGEREGDRRPKPNGDDDLDESQDVEMSAAEMDAMDQIEENAIGFRGANTQPAGSPSSRAGSLVAAPPPPPAAPPKRRMVITHDKYMTLQSLIVLHLSATERETGKGIDRDELIDWYLELKESEMQDVEELEYEKELITKMLRKLVKVMFCYSMFLSRLLIGSIGQLPH
jgi:DNA replication licensing factor MCM6